MKERRIDQSQRVLARLVRQARCRGPQRLVLAGEGEAVVLSGAEYARLLGEAPPTPVAPDDGLNWLQRMRAPFEAAGVFWPWEWDDEKRDWIVPEENAVSP